MSHSHTDTFYYCVMKWLVYWNLQVVHKDVERFGDRGLLTCDGNHHDADIWPKPHCRECGLKEWLRFCFQSTIYAQDKFQQCILYTLLTDGQVIFL